METQIEIKVYPLQWSLCHTHGGLMWYANGTDVRIRPANSFPADQERVEREKAAAQAEYDQRILSKVYLSFT